MEVETFEIEDAIAEDQCETSVAERAHLVRDLGLSGQQSLEGDDKKAFPFALMSKGEVAVYQIIFPKNTDFEEYSEERVPTRVLKVAKVAVEAGFLDGLEVWHKHNQGINVDPVLVGYTGPTHSRKYYLIARWGMALASYGELFTAAKATLIERYKQWRIEQLRRCDTALEQVEVTLTDEGLASIRTEPPNVWW